MRRERATGPSAAPNDVSGRERGNQDLLDIGGEDVAVHRRVDDHGRAQPVMAQAGDEGCCLPVSVRRGRHEPLAAGRPSVARRHVRGRAHLVQEDQPRRVQVRLAAPPQPAPQRDVAAPLFIGEQSFF